MDTTNHTNLSSPVAMAPANETSSPDPCASEDFFFVLYGPLYGIVCGFGLVGNLLSFAVLHKYSRTNVATYLLKALAVMDNLFLAIAALVQMYTAMVFHFGLIAQFTPIFPYFQTYAWPLTHMVQIGTVWMMVLVAANRFIAVCKPLHAPRLCRKRNVQVQLAVVTIAIVVYNIPRFFEYRYVMVNVTSAADNVTEEVEVNLGLASYHLYNILYENVAYCVFVFFLPLVILIVFNVHLVYDLRKAQECRKALKGRSSKEENNITLVMIIIIIVFIVCQTPASINQILYYMIDDAEKSVCGAYTKFFHVCNLLLTLNSAMNFVIYCLFRRQFQQELVALLCRRRKELPIRKTILLRAVHERTASSYVHSHSSGRGHAAHATLQEQVPLTPHDNGHRGEGRHGDSHRGEGHRSDSHRGDNHYRDTAELTYG